MSEKLIQFNGSGSGKGKLFLVYLAVWRNATAVYSSAALRQSCLESAQYQVVDRKCSRYIT